MSKLLFFIGNLDVGGAERVCVNLCNYWAKNNYNVTICLTTDESIKFNLDSKIKLVVLYKNSSWIHKIYQVRKLIREIRPRNVISFLPHVNILVLLSTLGIKTHVIISERIHPDFYSKFITLRFLRFFLYGFANRIVYQTDSAMRSLFYLNKRNSNEFVIANPITSKFLQSSCNYSSKIIISVGRLVPQKGHSQLIDIFSKIIKNHVEWKLVIVGEGELEFDLRAQINILNLNDSIFIYKNTDNILELFKKSSIFCLTSNFEGFPNTLLEAMAVGLSTVSFDCPSGPKELTDNGNNGFLIDLNNNDLFVSALEILVLSEDIRKSFGICSKKFVENNFKSDIIFNKWHNLLV
jgi:GalNAc-alpha-(1->4)-GalNAc-alpha-(1->3)-diNAcBac-PP-undecaprenol alpha-1,4-N-acetyl-D-galactosaminyltransferase